MKTSTWLAGLLAIGAAMEGGLALALFVDAPRVVSILLESRLDATGEVVAGIAGGGLLALGIACWRARATPMAPASLGVAWALLAYNLIACLVLAHFVGTTSGSGTPALAVAGLHALFAAALLLALLRPHFESAALQ